MKILPEALKAIIGAFVFALLIYPQQSLSAEEVKTDAYKHLTAAQGKMSDNQRRFVTYKYYDPVAGMEAFRLLIPQGWQAEGAVTWSANLALPAEASFRFYNPNGDEQLELFPTQSYFWTNNQLFLSTNPPGSLRFGTLVAQPLDLDGAFRNVILPTFRRNVSNLQFVNRERVPELERLARGIPTPGLEAYAEGGKIRIAYLENGRAMEEEIYAVASQFVLHQPPSYMTGSYFIKYWYIDYAFSFKDKRGELDSQSDLFQTMIFSFQINPNWYAKVLNTKERLIQIANQRTKMVGKISSIIAQAGDQLREDQQRDWEQRQKINDKIAQNFDNYNRGLERYVDPFTGNKVELPAKHENAWTNPLGDIITNDSPSFNPRINSQLDWRQMKRAR